MIFTFWLSAAICRRSSHSASLVDSESLSLNLHERMPPLPSSATASALLGGCNPHHSAAFTIAATQRVRLPSAAVATAARRHRGRQELAVVNAVARLVFVVTYMLAFAQIAVTHLSSPNNSFNPTPIRVPGEIQRIGGAG